MAKEKRREYTLIKESEGQIWKTRKTISAIYVEGEYVYRVSIPFNTPLVIIHHETRFHERIERHNVFFLHDKRIHYIFEMEDVAHCFEKIEPEL